MFTTETDGVVKRQPARKKRWLRCTPPAVSMCPAVLDACQHLVNPPFTPQPARKPTVSGEPQAVSMTHLLGWRLLEHHRKHLSWQQRQVPPCAVLQQRSSLCLIVMELDGFGYLSLDDLSGLIHDTEMDIWFKFILTSSRLEFLDSLKLVGDRSLTGLGWNNQSYFHRRGDPVLLSVSDPFRPAHLDISHKVMQVFALEMLDVKSKQFAFT